RMVIAGQATLAVSVTVRDPPLTLVMSSEALFGPTVVGWNPTATVASLPRSMLVVLGEPTKNCEALGPEITKGGVRVTGVAALIVTVAPTIAPIDWVPKSML